MDLFSEVKRRVKLGEAAERWGLKPNRAGFVCCPIHGEKTPSLKLWEDHWYCFGCHAGGSVIDLAAGLFGLTPLDAARKLDEDWGLGLYRPRPLTEEEKEELAVVRRVAAVHREFEKWRSEMLARLCAAVRVGNQALLRSPDSWTEEEAEAVRNAPALEYWLDRLEAGDEEAQMEIFRDRRGIEKRCGMILENTLRKSKAD